MTKGETDVRNVIAWIVVIGVCAVWAAQGYESLDQKGYISHQTDVPVYINGSWMTGEYRNCLGSADSTTGKMSVLDCTNGLSTSTHELPVTFKGEYPTTNTDIKASKKAWVWRCQRETSSLTCKMEN